MITGLARKLVLEELLKKRFFVGHAYEIYGGLTRVLDLGPLGCELQMNILDIWKRVFVREEKLLLLKTSCLTPKPVLKASGHLDKFSDPAVRDVETGEMFRLDHLIKKEFSRRLDNSKLLGTIRTEYEQILSKLSSMDVEEMGKIVEKHSIRSPVTGNKLSDVFEVNLMFKTQPGGTSNSDIYLRPELSQSTFVNFRKLSDFHRRRLPFGVAQIGPAFRDEVTRGSSLTRMREFTLAEIQYFYDPLDNTHSKLAKLADKELRLYSACDQLANRDASVVTLGEAVDGKLLSPILAYFMAKTHIFLETIGIDARRLRFRQHVDREMAHYAKNCWDAECLTSNGWLECVGCADRGCYDLLSHSDFTGHNLTALRPSSVPILKPCDTVHAKEHVPENVQAALSALDHQAVNELRANLEGQGQHKLKVDKRKTLITKDMVEFKKGMTTVYQEDYVPAVVEPSFGIDRIMYSVLDHNFNSRKDNPKRAYFTFPSSIAPYKCVVLPLGPNSELTPFVQQLSASLDASGVHHELDDTRFSIGRRYVRSDEMGTPFALTVDFDTLLEPHTVTIRDRDTTEQVRVLLSEVSKIVNDLSAASVTFEQLLAKYPKFERSQTQTTSGVER